MNTYAMYISLKNSVGRGCHKKFFRDERYYGTKQLIKQGLKPTGIVNGNKAKPAFEVIMLDDKWN